MPRILLNIIYYTYTIFMVANLLRAQECNSNDPLCRASTNQQVALSIYTDNSTNTKYVLLPDTMDNLMSPDTEFRIYQAKEFPYAETGPLMVQESQTAPTVGTWAFKLDPMKAWQEIRSGATDPITLNELSSIRLQNIQNPGIAILKCAFTKQQPDNSKNLVFIKFVMSRPLASRLRLTVVAMTTFTYAMNNQDTSPPFMLVRDLFNVTLDSVVPKDALTEANRTLLNLPKQSKLLEKKSMEFLYNSMVPTDFNPGVYLKPQSNYGVVATLEFDTSNEAGTKNATKILYENGDVYLHGSDRYRFLAKQTPPTLNSSTLKNSSLTDLEFMVRCWDGISMTENSLGPPSILKISFGTPDFRLPRLKTDDATLHPLDLPNQFPTVPYRLDTGSKYETGFNVGDLMEWFFVAPVNAKQGQGQSQMGLGVLSTGTGDLGNWQYRLDDEWRNFPDFFRSGWKLFRTEQQQQKQSIGGNFTSFDFTHLKELPSIQVFLIGPTAKIRFKPSNDKSFWSSSDAFRQATLAFLAWKPQTFEAVSSSVVLADLDLPNCQACDQLGISKQGIIICAQRFGCDKKLSSMAQFDACDVCNGLNECLDCHHMPYGKAKWTCGVCTEDGSQFKDCRGQCNGTFQLTPDGQCVDPNEPLGCDGKFRSTAVINDCGICVLGITGLPYNYSKDVCGVCNGSNACVGCDGLPHSEKVLDICGVCKHPKETTFNNGCGAKMSGAFPTVMSMSNSTSRFNVTGLAMGTAITCHLEFMSYFSENYTLKGSLSIQGPANLTVIVAVDNKTKIMDGNYTAYTMHLDHADTAGIYNLRCMADSRFEISAATNTSVIYVVDYSALQLAKIEPDTLSLTTPGAMKVKVTGYFPQSLLSEPFCHGQARLSEQTSIFPVEILNEKEAFCNLASVNKSKSIDLHMILRSDAVSDFIIYQKPLVVTIKAKWPRPIEAKFSESAVELLIKFDLNTNGPTDCKQIFENNVLAKLGGQPSCKFSADTLHVVFGSNAEATINDTVLFKQNVIRQSDAEFPEFTPSNMSVIISPPDKKLVPTIVVDSEITASTCAENVHLTVRKSTGDGGRHMTFSWTVVSAERLSDQRQILIPPALQSLVKSAHSESVIIPMSTLTEDIAYTLNVVACNFLQECSQASAIHLNIGNDTDNLLFVQVLGLDPPVRCGIKRHLEAMVKLKTCENIKIVTENLELHWQILTNDTMFLESRDWNFHLPAIGFTPGEAIQIKVQAVYQDEDNEKNYTATNSMTVILEPQPLWVRLGATQIKHGVGDELVLDGSASSDPNQKIKTLGHQWTCNRLDSRSQSGASFMTPCYVKANESANTTLLFEQVFDVNREKLIVPPNTLAAGTYNFTDTVTSYSLSDKATVSVTLVPGRMPKVEFVPSLAKKPCVDLPITLKANIYAMENVTVNLTFVELQGYGNVTLPSALQKHASVHLSSSDITDRGYIMSFTIPSKDPRAYPIWTGLTANTQYAVKIVANTTSGLTGEAFLTFLTDEPPTMGLLTLSTAPSDSVIYGLVTPVRLTATGFIDNPNDLPLTYRFGFKTYWADGTTDDYWLPSSTVDELSLYLPSAETSRPSCGRIGYQAMVKVCDIYGACTTAVTPAQPFQVQRSANTTSAIEDLNRKLEHDLASGNGFGAFLKLYVVRSESCGNLSDHTRETSNAVACHILNHLNSMSDQEDLMNAVRFSNELLLTPKAVVGETLLSKLKEKVSELEQSLGLKDTTTANAQLSSQRSKRSTSNASPSPSSRAIDNDDAMQLLGAYEIIVSHSSEEQSVPVYLKGTLDLLAEMCLGRDSTQPPVDVHSKGATQPLCVIEARGVFMDAAVVNRNISIAALASESAAQIQFNSGLQQDYSMWSCNHGRSTCASVCLATAVYFVSVDSHPTPVGAFVLKNDTNTSAPLSDIHYTELIDPISKELLSINERNWERYTILVPLLRVSKTGYYMCKIFTLSTNQWTSTFCQNIGIKHTGSANTYVACQCSIFGYIAVFETAPPTLPEIRPNEAVNISLMVQDYTERDLQVDRQMLADKMNTSKMRIVDLRISSPPISTAFGDQSSPANKQQRFVTFILRPPSRFDWTESNQLLLRLNSTISNLQAPTFDWKIAPLSFAYFPLKRELKNDQKARSATIKILNDFDQTIAGSGSGALATSLTEQLASALNMSSSRIKDFSFVKGSIITTFTIDTPKAASDISAELAALILSDQVKYDELLLHDINGNVLHLDSNYTIIKEIEKAPVAAPADLLPVIIGSIVGGAFLVVIIFVIALVVIKNRGRRDKVSPISTPGSNTSPNSSQRNSAQTSITVRRISITDGQNGSSLRSRNT